MLWKGTWHRQGCARGWILVDRLPRGYLFVIFRLSKRTQSQGVWESTEVSDWGL